MTHRKLILADRIRSGAQACPRYRLAIQEGILWWRKTRIFVTYCEDADELPLLNDKHPPGLIFEQLSWFEVWPRRFGMALVVKVEDPILQATLTLFLQEAKINGDVR